MADEKNGLSSIFATSTAPMVFAKGGTTTTAWDNEMKRRSLEADERRALQDEKAAMSRKSAVAQDPHEVARMNTLKLGGHSDHAVIVLQLRSADGSVKDWEVCELNVLGGPRVGVGVTGQPPGEEEAGFSLTMVCPRCVLTRHREMQFSQLTLRSTQKRMVFRPNVIPKWMKSHANLWVNPNEPSEVYQVAGTVDVDEWCACDHEGCGYRFKIDDSVVVS